MSDDPIFHAGEQALHRRLGVFEEVGPRARKIVRPFLLEQQRSFYEALPFVVAAARDREGRPWASLLTGRPGFMGSPDPTHLRIDARPVAGDALAHQLHPGMPVGLLGIELATRRRNRVNGSISQIDCAGLELEVAQAFGNCPRYIRKREWRWVASDTGMPTPTPDARHGRIFTPALRQRIAMADTFFIATGFPGCDGGAAHGMDASHRGGAPGFVKIEGECRLVFPDYSGNDHYNTLGNLVVDDRTGLLFVDFETGGLIQLTGTSTIDWDSPDVDRHPGAHRLIVFELDEAIEITGAVPLRWRSTEAEEEIRVR